MEPSFDGPHELERHVESQMRAQERQLAWVRLGMAALAGVFLAVVAPQLPAAPVLAGVAAALGVWSLAVPWLLHRFPAREVGIISTVIDMAAVTVAVYVASDAVDVYLFYGLVILGTALRFGLGASIWSSVVMAGMYLAVVVAPTPLDDPVRPLLGDAPLVYVVDDALRRLAPAAHGGNDEALAEAWRARADERRPRVGEGI